MEKRKRRSGSGISGFTLVELMVVIVIIGLLAALVVPKFVARTDDAKVAAAKAQIHSLKQALEMFKLKTGSYPSTSEGLEALINNEYENFLEQDVIPLDPWNNPYVYASPGSEGHDFEIVSYGEDGAPGGTDFAADIVSYNLQGSRN